MDFYVGQKVVCVDDSPNPEGFSLPIKKGFIYTVSNTDMDTRGDVGVQIFESAVPRTMFRRPFFNAKRFRPVAERKTDISIFTRMLTPHKEIAKPCLAI